MLLLHVGSSSCTLPVVTRLCLLNFKLQSNFKLEYLSLFIVLSLLASVISCDFLKVLVFNCIFLHALTDYTFRFSLLVIIFDSPDLPLFMYPYCCISCFVFSKLNYFISLIFLYVANNLYLLYFSYLSHYYCFSLNILIYLSLFSLSILLLFNSY